MQFLELFEKISEGILGFFAGGDVMAAGMQENLRSDKPLSDHFRALRIDYGIGFSDYVQRRDRELEVWVPDARVARLWCSDEDTEREQEWEIFRLFI